MARFVVCVSCRPSAFARNQLRVIHPLFSTPQHFTRGQSMTRLGGLSAFVFMLCTLAFGQQPPSNSTALSYAAQSVAAMNGGNTVSDATLTGTMNTWMAGSTADTGTASLKVSGYGESRIDMQLVSSGALSQIRDASTGIAQGEAISGGAGTQYSYQNCVTDADWFYPLFSAMAIAPNSGIVLNYIGPETFEGSSVQHVQSYYYQSGLDPASEAQVQTESTIDYYLDATTFLPVAENFNMFAD